MVLRPTNRFQSTTRVWSKIWLVLLSIGLIAASLLGMPPVGAPAADAVPPDGSWVGEVGGEGYALAAFDSGADRISMPKANVSISGNGFAWAPTTTDTRALESPDQTSRAAGTWYSGSAVVATLTFTEAFSGPISVYSIDWDNGGRAQTLEVASPGGTWSAPQSGFSGGQWFEADITVVAGDVVTVTATRTAGHNSVISGIFLGGAGEQIPEIGGSWLGQYGSDGYVLAGYAEDGDVEIVEPAFFDLTAGQKFTWEQTTTENRALQHPYGGERQATTWFGNTVEGVFTFSEAYTGSVSVYGVDWDTYQRSQVVTVTGGGTHDPITMSDMHEGAWATFDIDVQPDDTVTVRVDRTGGSNAVVSGFFLGGPGDIHIPTTQGVQGDWYDTYGADGFILANQADDRDLQIATFSTTASGTHSWSLNTAERRALDTGRARQAHTWQGDDYTITLDFTQAFTGPVSLYGVDWDGHQRVQKVEVTTGAVTEEKTLNTLRGGAWVSFDVSVQNGDTVTIRVQRIRGLNAVISGVFLGGGGAANPTPIPGTDPYQCAAEGGNAFFPNWTYIDAQTGSLLGCYYRTSCISQFPVWNMLNWIQRVGCNYEDELLTTLETAGIPWEVMIAPVGTADEARLAYAGGPAPSTGLAPSAPTAPALDVVRTPVTPIYEPTPPGLPKTTPSVPPGTTPPAPRTIPPGVRIGTVGVIVVSGVAYTTYELLQMTPEQAQDRQDRLIDQVEPHVQSDSEPERRAAALTCVAELMSHAIAEKVADRLFEAFDIGTEIFTDGEIVDGSNQGKHICEVIPVYMPGDLSNAGSGMPQTTNHIREALGLRAPSTDPLDQEGLIDNPLANMILTYGDNETRAPAGWYTAWRPCKGQPPGDGKTCDEYPFRSTHQGGAIGTQTTFGVRLASLRLVDTVPEQSAQAGDLSAFYGGCGVVKAPEAVTGPNLAAYPDSNFVVFPLPNGPFTSKFVCP